MRLLLIAHLFKLCNMRCLFASHLFQLSDISILLGSHLFKIPDALVGSLQLISKHFDVGLDALGHPTLSIHLDVQSFQVLQLDKRLLEAPLLGKDLL